MNAAADIVEIFRETGSENCLPVGARLGEFEIRGVIGEGGFGIVYLAFDESLQRTVAIKEYMPAVLASRGADKSVTVRAKQHRETFLKGLRSFINEARLLAQFDHPALIKVYRFWEQNGTGYMAMRYYEGRTLKNIVSDDPSVVTEAWLKSVAGQMLEALETLYRMNVLHRDISPDNIMIQGDGRAVLLDFGAARQIISDMTQALTVVLKPGYAPVEQYADDDGMTQGPWTDIYSLSAVMYFAVAGKAPPTSVGRMIKDPIELLQKSGRAGFSAGFLAAIDKGLGIRPEDRPQSIAEFRRLLGIAPGTQTPVVPAQTAAPGRRPGERRKTDKPSAKPASGTGARRASRKPLSPKAVAVLGAGVVFVAAVLVLHAIRRHPAPARLEPVAAAPEALEQVVDEETLAWDLLEAKADATPEDIREYMRHYPAGRHADLAKVRLASLGAQSAAPAEGEAQPGGMAAPAAQPEKPAEEKAAASIKLIVKPWGSIFVDGALKGVSPPLKTLAVPAGKHRIRIDNPNFPTHVVDIDANGKAKIKIEYDFNADKKKSSS